MIEAALMNKLEAMAERHAELERMLADPEVIAHQVRYRALLREHGSLAKIIPDYVRMKELEARQAEAQSIIENEDDRDLCQLAREELQPLADELTQLTGQIQRALVEDDPDADRNVIIEIRAGTGGDEASLFAADLFRMYSCYAERHKWNAEILNSNPTELGGFKEITFALKGKEVYKRLQYECGGHRVQRVPATEAGGRIHTSAVTVAVLPEVEDVEVELREEDMRIDRMRSSGPGGQSVNKTSSAIRITHFPTGIVVSMQDQKSQHKNLAKALTILRSRIYEKLRFERDSEVSEQRRKLIGSGDRSDRVRTYNFLQNRVTDHRINLSLYSLDAVMMGELDPLIDKLIEYDAEEKLKEL